MDRPFKLRRCVLSVPGNRENMLRKAKGIAVDFIMLDLEDSVPMEEKEKARQMVAELLSEGGEWSSLSRSVRINPMDSPYAYRDLIGVFERAGEFIDTVVIPKVNHPCEVRAVDYILTQIEEAMGFSPGKIGIEASIETAEGLLRVEEIAFSSERLESLVFGIADYAASVGALVKGVSGHGDSEDFYPGHRWHFPLSRMIMAAKAAGIAAIDAPYGNYKDPEGLRLSCLLSAALGCDGKWAIHPDQVAIIEEVFSPGEEDIERSKRIIEAYELSKKEKRGSLAFEGKMVDGASLRIARRICTFAEIMKKRQMGREG
ncbi:MAG: CoA ester lyase [Syntrophobacterales bacterium]|nr:CoA ester lyase [Syntrophobacterales bacterium]